MSKPMFDWFESRRAVGWWAVGGAVWWVVCALIAAHALDRERWGAAALWGFCALSGLYLFRSALQLYLELRRWGGRK